jgi:hypothetical protein
VADATPVGKPFDGIPFFWSAQTPRSRRDYREAGSGRRRRRPPGATPRWPTDGGERTVGPRRSGAMHRPGRPPARAGRSAGSERSARGVIFPSEDRRACRSVAPVPGCP